MLSHATIGISDFARAVAFYGAVMDELGFALRFAEPAEQLAGWMQPGRDRPLFFITRPFDGGAPTAGNGAMVALLAPSRDAVSRAHARALALGAQCEGPPGLRPQYHPAYFGAYFRDPDGNKICVCCHDPA